MKTLLTIATLLAFSNPTPTGDPLARLPTTPIDIEVKEALASDIYMLMEDVTATRFEVEPCADQTLSFKLQGAAPALLLRMMGSELGRTYSWVDDRLVVHCEEPPEGAAQTIDLTLKEVSAASAFGLVAQTSGIALRTEGCTELQIDLQASNVTADAVLDALVLQLDAARSTIDGVVVVRC